MPRAGLQSMYELFYSYGGHGGPYSSIAEATQWAKNLLAGDRHLKWIKIKRYSHRGVGGFGATVKTISQKMEGQKEYIVNPNGKETDWVPVHALRRTPDGGIQILTERGVMSNPNRRKGYLAKVRGLFTKGAKALGNTTKKERYGDTRYSFRYNVVPHGAGATHIASQFVHTLAKARKVKQKMIAKARGLGPISVDIYDTREGTFY